MITIENWRLVQKFFRLAVVAVMFSHRFGPRRKRCAYKLFHLPVFREKYR